MEKEKIQVIDIELIKVLMKSRGIDEKEMAKLLGVTPPTVKRFLGGADQRYLSSEFLFKLSKIFNVSSDYLLNSNRS